MGRFNALDFKFDGVLSSTKGLVLAEIDGDWKTEMSVGGTFEIVKDRTFRNPRSFYYGGYYSEPHVFEISIASLEEPTAQQTSDINKWLFNNFDNEYKQLEILQDDMMGLYYYCILSNPQITYINGYARAWKVTVECDSQFMYRNPITHTLTKPQMGGNTGTLQIINNSSFAKYIYFPIEFKSNGSSVTIINQSDNNRTTTFNNLVSGEVINVDELMQIKSSTGNKRLKDTNKIMLRLCQGVNNIQITGDIEYFNLVYTEALMV